MAASQLVPVLVLPLVRCPCILFFCSLRGIAFILRDGGDLGDFIAKSTHLNFLSTIYVCLGVVSLSGLVQVRLLYL
jgi:hypothetical protein